MKKDGDDNEDNNKTNKAASKKTKPAPRPSASTVYNHQLQQQQSAKILKFLNY